MIDNTPLKATNPSTWYQRKQYNHVATYNSYSPNWNREVESQVQWVVPVNTIKKAVVCDWKTPNELSYERFAEFIGPD
jgi:hypothetical protein